MRQLYDAIIIGAGIIGACTGYEMAKRGYKVLNIDKLGDAGMGSTSGSCAIIRFHYSTTEGVAMAREGYYYWLDWPKYLEKRDPAGMATYRNTGVLVVKTPVNKNLARIKAALDEFGIGYPTATSEPIPAPRWATIFSSAAKIRNAIRACGWTIRTITTSTSPININAWLCAKPCVSRT